MKARSTTISVDVGSDQSGIAVVSDRVIVAAHNMCNTLIPLFIKDQVSKSSKAIVIIEDIKPYSIQLSQQVIDTCKYIGELCYRLKMLAIEYRLVSRSSIKEWVFNNFNSLAVERINKRIEYMDGWNVANGKKGLKNKDGQLRKASFIWVDDRIVIAAMKQHWKIETPLPGKSNRYGLSKHSWQALALATYHISGKF